MKLNDDEILKVLGYNVAYYRQESHLTQEKLAEYSLLSSEYISNIENGKGNVTTVSLNRIANTLDVSPDLLLKQEDHGELKKRVNSK